jgi:integrase
LRGAVMVGLSSKTKRRTLLERLPAEMRAERRTLGQALNETAKEKWEGRRCYRPVLSQALTAIEALGGEDVRVVTIKADRVKVLARKWVAAGLSPGTVKMRICALKAMGVSVEGAMPRQLRPLKWWLDPDTHERLRQLLQPKTDEFQRGTALRTFDANTERENRLFLDYVDWTLATGLRVEETLRVRRHHFSDQFRTLTVPGTKTARSQAGLPLSTEAQEIAGRLFRGRDDAGGPMFPISYQKLGEVWRRCRKELGITDPLATLKAFRRGAARRLHAQNGMPLDVLRQYLRHGAVQTTMSYLRLTGGYSEEETRRWLK